MLSTIFLPNFAEGISIGLDPVAIIIFFVSMFSIDLSGLVTSTLLLEIIFPLPTMCSTLFCANKEDIPPVSFFTILSFLFIIVSKSRLIS